MMPGGSEQDTHRGTPLGDDAYAYQRYVAGGFFDSENVEWTVVQERSADAGTQGTWSKPSTSFWSYLPGELWNQTQQRAGAVWGAAKQIGYTLADIGKDAVV